MQAYKKRQKLINHLQTTLYSKSRFLHIIKYFNTKSSLRNIVIIINLK
jgi:hypothetical protein